MLTQELVGRFQIKRAAENDGAMTFAGYGSVFNVVDWYGDTILPGAFTDTLKEAKAPDGSMPKLMVNHGSLLGGPDDLPVGIWTEMREDNIGLWVEGKLAPTPRGQETYQLLKMEHDGKPQPALDGLSIGFIPKEWVNRTKPEEPRRSIRKVDLLEVSVVNFPANRKARIMQVKAAEATDREIERILMDRVGFSRSQARALMRGGLTALRTMQDADAQEPEAMQDAGEAELAAMISRLTSTLLGASHAGPEHQ